MRMYSAKSVMDAVTTLGSRGMNPFFEGFRLVSEGRERGTPERVESIDFVEDWSGRKGEGGYAFTGVAACAVPYATSVTPFS